MAQATIGKLARLTPILWLSLVLAACNAPQASDDTGAAPPASAKSIQVEYAWIRVNRPGTAMAAGYMQLRNAGTQETTLTAATIEGVGRTEMHSMEMRDGMMRMRQMDNYRIAGGAEAAFEPGGNHLMLMDLQTELVAGESRKARLSFADGSSQELEFKILADAPNH